MTPDRKRRFQSLAKVQSLVRNESGLPATVRIRRANAKAVPKAVQAAVLLAENGATMLQATKAIERMLDDGKADIDLDRVASPDGLVAGLVRMGVACEVREPRPAAA